MRESAIGFIGLNLSEVEICNSQGRHSPYGYAPSYKRLGVKLAKL